MRLRFAEDADLELFEQLHGWRVELRLVEAGPFLRFRILGIEQNDHGDNILYGFRCFDDWDCPGWDRFLSTRETDQAEVLPVDLITDLVIYP